MSSILRKIYLLKLVCLLQLIYFSIRIFSIDKLFVLFIPSKVAPKQNTISTQQLQNDLDSATWRFSWLNTCLPRSILLCRMMRQAGHDANVKIGAFKPCSSSNKQLLAHAWVTDVSGRVFDVPGVDATEYVELKS